MNRSLLILLLAVLAVGATGYALYRQHRTQNALTTQLQELSNVLQADNSEAAQSANNSVKSIHAAVARNQSQPREQALLAAAERLHTKADLLAAALSKCAEELLVATRNVSSQPTLPHPNETQTVDQQLGLGGRAQAGLQQQLADYGATLRSLHPAATFNLSAPNFAGMPVVAALAHLAQIESDIRKAETSALNHLSAQIGSTRLTPRLFALATAESEYVAPGALYKAELRLATALGSLPAGLRMRCNGQPVPVDANFIGQVRFVAPTQPGPASWTGTVAFRVGGRDTTFQVKVPYRVARP